MNDDGPPLPETVVCGRCLATGDSDDNFCRKCGLPLHDDANLPSLRDSARLPAISRPSMQVAVARGAAALAAGKIAELIVRRMVRGLWNRGPGRSLPAKVAKPQVVPRGTPSEEANVVSEETFLLRRVRIRR